MNTRDEILTFLQQHKEELFATYHLSKLGLFGSYARAEATEQSDVDVIFDFTEEAEDIYTLKMKLKTYLSSVFERSVDLAREKYLKPYAKEMIGKDIIYV
jgi:predicted nucleotidyltransferase